ncbi:MAG: hypothetical protein K0R66_725 [Gammaproteobacteria bacterium]|jgi:uncharacterized membrane protein YccC|nr:hypothetical protein [Gammaproteobacteria bacterium]
MNLSAEAKLGCRAAVAVLIAVFISHFFHLNRGYWAVLTTLALISQSWGESLQKAYTRFGMTIAGCIFAYVLFLLIGHIHALVVVCLLLGIFGMAYFFAVSYAWAMFFVGIIVVFIFAYLGLWSLQLLWERIYETALGCVIAAVVTGLFMPIYSRQKFYRKLPEVLNKFKDLMALTFQNAKKHDALSSTAIHQNLNHLFLEIKTLTKEYATAKYEMIILLQQRKSMELFLHKLELAFHYLSSLAVTLRLLATQPIYLYSEPELEELWLHLEAMLQQIELAVNRQGFQCLPSWDDSKSRSLLQEKFMQAKLAEKFNLNEMMQLTACVYYSRMLDTVLGEMLGILAEDQIKK